MLVLEQGIASSHVDYEVWGDCKAGFRENKDLVISYQYTCCYDHSQDYVEEAVISKDEALAFAKELEVHLTEIPAEIDRRYHYPWDTGDATDVRKVFDDILASLLDIHIRYRIVRRKIPYGG